MPTVIEVGVARAGAESWLVSPIIRWALLDTGRVRARIAASDARAKEALIAYDQRVLRALGKTDDAFKAYGANGETLQLRLQEEAAANREAARLAQFRLSGGEGAYLDLLDPQRSFASRRSLAVARTNHRLAIVSIYKALGGSWEVAPRGAAKTAAPREAPSERR